MRGAWGNHNVRSFGGSSGFAALFVGHVHDARDDARRRARRPAPRDRARGARALQADARGSTFRMHEAGLRNEGNRQGAKDVKVLFARRALT